jgi:acetyl esterase/lipase
MRLGISMVTGTALLGLSLAACSFGGSTSSSPGAAPSRSRSAASAASCPKPQIQMPNAPDTGAPPQLVMAKTVKPTNTSTSTVVDPTGPQMECGKTQVETKSDVAYSTPTTAGKQVSLKMDVQVPKTDGKKPLILYVTGGGFMMASKVGNLDQRTYLAEQGYTVASIEYRTIANGATYTDGVADVKSAIRYLRAHAHDYGIDGSKVAVWGQSAGGYLVSMVGTTNGVKKFDVGDNLDQSSDVQAVIDEFGPSDLSDIGADYDAAARNAYQAPGNFTAQWVFGPGTKKSVTQDPKAVAAANPATYADKSDPPFLLLHGSADTLVSPSQTLLVHNALRAKGVDSTRIVVRGAGHGDLAFMGDARSGALWSTQAVMGKITSFVGKNLGS